MNKQKAIDNIIATKTEEIKKYRRWIKSETSEVEACLKVIEKLPDDLFVDCHNISRASYNIYLYYPLDKRLITKIIKILKKNGVLYDDYIDSFGFSVFFRINSNTNVHLMFKENIENSTCKLKKIGEQKMERIQFIYEISCLEDK